MPSYALPDLTPDLTRLEEVVRQVELDHETTFHIEDYHLHPEDSYHLARGTEWEGPYVTILGMTGRACGQIFLSWLDGEMYAALVKIAVDDYWLMMEAIRPERSRP
jgi:hypothetical protein